MRARLVPHPLLSVLIAAVWIGLVNTFSFGHLLLGILLGLLVPWATSHYWPDRPVIRRPGKIAVYVAIVLWDILVSNVRVAWLVLFRRSDALRSAFIAVPVDLRTPEAIAVLAGTITMTPGTVSADLAADGSTILVHCLDVDDPQAQILDIKQRYERRLKEIFE